MEKILKHSWLIVFILPLFLLDSWEDQDVLQRTPYGEKSFSIAGNAVELQARGEGYLHDRNTFHTFGNVLIRTDYRGRAERVSCKAEGVDIVLRGINNRSLPSFLVRDSGYLFSKAPPLHTDFGLVPGPDFHGGKITNSWRPVSFGFIRSLWIKSDHPRPVLRRAIRERGVSQIFLDEKLATELRAPVRRRNNPVVPFLPSLLIVVLFFYVLVPKQYFMVLLALPAGFSGFGEEILLTLIFLACLSRRLKSYADLEICIFLPLLFASFGILLQMLYLTTNASVFGIKILYLLPLLPAIPGLIQNIRRSNKEEGLKLLSAAAIFTVATLIYFSGYIQDQETFRILRDFLDEYIRPRLRSAVLFYPLFFLSFTGISPFLYKLRFVFGLGAGSVTLNSFLHYHTPIGLTLAREGAGICLALLLTGLVYLIISRSRMKTLSDAKNG